MHGLGLLSSQAIARAYDLSCFSHVVDLGGSSGHLAAALARRYRSLRATVIDLPEVVARVRKRADPRVTFVAGDFLRDKLPAADLFALGRILHHRSDDESLALLRRLYDRLPAGGAVLIAERFAEPAGPVDAHMNSLHMLICSTRGGRERSAASYAAMLRAAGFTPAKPCRTPRVLDAMLGVKRTPAPPRGGRRGGAQ